MTGRMRHITVKDARGHCSTVSIGVETDEPSQTLLLFEIVDLLERQFRGIADHHRVEVMHTFTCSTPGSVETN